MDFHPLFEQVGDIIEDAGYLGILHSYSISEFVQRRAAENAEGFVFFACR